LERRHIVKPTIFNVPMLPRTTSNLQGTCQAKWHCAIGPYEFIVSQSKKKIKQPFAGSVICGESRRGVYGETLQETLLKLEKLALPSLKNLAVALDRIREL
jgi:hypothetical protein